MTIFSHTRRALAIGACLLATASPGSAQEMPKSGGELKLAVRGEPTSFDCQTATSFNTLQYLAPHYSTLLRFDQENYPEIVADTAESWDISDDLKTYTVTLKEGIEFHDGSTLDAEDVKATFERIAHPPEGVVSARQTALSDLESIEVTDPRTVKFTLKSPSSSFLAALANPWFCLYSADLMKENPDYPDKLVMGTGPFTFTEYVSGDHWSGKRFDGYFKEGKPYLDSFRNQLVSGPAATNAIAAGELHGNIRFISVPAKDQMQSARGDELTFQVTPSTSTSLIDVNTRKPPFDDLRVRRALSLAIDRNIGVQALGDQAGQRWAHLIFRHGHDLAPTDEELKSYPGFGEDIEAAREEARNLLKEAGQSDLSFTLINRNLPVPYEPLAVFFIDQWRQIGVNVKHEPLDTAAWAGRLSSGDYEVGIDLNAPSSDDPTDVLLKYVPGSSADRTGIEDAKLVELFEQQNRTLDEAVRAKLAKEFVVRAVELLYVIPTFNAERLIVLDSKVKGWKVPPSFYVGLDLADVWIDG
tara:strand:- start:96845 stop:98428 length:1584 start_codon:yes stop_codon:yes gene_type:complete